MPIIDIDAGGSTFNLGTGSYHLLIATGDMNGVYRAKHANTHRAASTEAVSFNFPTTTTTTTTNNNDEQGSTTTTTTTTTMTSTPMSTSKAIDLSSFHENYHDCGISKGCFGTKFPIDPNCKCIKTGDCDVMVTYNLNSGSVELHIHGMVESDKYLALGFSHDDKMGDDLVFHCKAGSSEAVKPSWNTGKTNNALDSEVMIHAPFTKFEDSVRLLIDPLS